MTNTDGRNALGGLWNSIQSWLFPMLEDEIGELDAKHRQFVAVCELCAPQNHMAAYHWIGNGCPPSDRLTLCKAFIAKAEALAEPLRTARPPSLPFRKPAVLGESGGSAASRTGSWRGFARASAVWDFATTRDLIDALRHRPALRRLCGWETWRGSLGGHLFTRFRRLCQRQFTARDSRSADYDTLR